MGADRYEVRAPSRWRWLRRMAVSVGISLAFYFAWQLGSREVAKRQGERELAAAQAAVARDDPDWTWEGVNAARRRPPGGRNGAELVPRIKRLTRPEWGQAGADPRWAGALDAHPNRELPPELLTAVRGELAASAEAVALARTFNDRPWGHRDIDLLPNVLDTKLQDTQDTRHAASLLRWACAVAVADRDARRAAADVHAMLNTSRSIGDEPFLISQLVRISGRNGSVRAAERVLAHFPDADLEVFQAALAADAEEALLLSGVRGDRAVFDRLFDNLLTGATTPGQSIDRGFNDLGGRLGWWHYRGHLASDRAYAFGWMTHCVEAARLPIHEQRAAFAAVPVPPNEPNRILSQSMLPAVDKVAAASWRSTAEARCAVAGIGCERFRQQHGRFPNELAEAVPAFLAAVPLDPFTGEPLRFAKSDRGVVVYTAGHDGGGAGDLDAPRDPADPHPRFRLWSPDHRRLPPPAEPQQ